ncbi:MAG: hypothetical protein OXH19_13185 [Chloroflexi bacterium]|nr:hypothetical protein [Chloroflexota bacterium]MCY3587947.1 hypothetical protein [Chloroflexota bacterium]MCY3684565.1 hypothetical protein [Chloroflexota bacterium]MDE2710103.1 hypothetical protein [Chloroflexota bacterium]
MTDQFADQLQVELDGIQTELDRLDAKRRLIEQLLTLESGAGPAAPVAAAAASGRAARRPAPAAKRPRRPRGLITGKIREFLAGRREPAHGTEILAYLERADAAPLSAKPMATLQSALQRLKEQGEVENMGRNRWRLRLAEAEASAPAAPPSAAPSSPAAGPPVVTSTTRFGARPGEAQ